MTPGLRSVLRTLAARPAGVHSSDPALTTWTTTRICTEGNRMTAAGELHKAQLHAREARFFTTTEARDGFVAAHTPKQRSYGRRGLMWRSVTRAPWAPDAEAVITPSTIFTQCPSHAPRFSEQRFAFVHGA